MSTAVYDITPVAGTRGIPITVHIAGEQFERQLLVGPDEGHVEVEDGDMYYVDREGTKYRSTDFPEAYIHFGWITKREV